MNAPDLPAQKKRCASAWRAPVLAALLAALTAGLFWPATGYELVDLDDLIYIGQNQIVLDGLRLESIRLAFTQVWQGMWAPGLWLSYMLDVECFGRGPWGFHLTNIWLHSLNATLVFALFWGWTKKPWRAFWAAAFWAWHPLRVESVAWVAERKDVLSGLLFLLCIGTYWLSKREPEPGAIPKKIFGGASALLLALGLLVKPMLMTAPFVLLLLDFWPLKRIQIDDQDGLRQLLRLVLEKWAFWAIAVAAAGVAMNAHERVGAVQNMPWAVRLIMVPLHYAFYLFKTTCPRNLTALYEQLSFYRLDFLVAVLILGGLSLWAWWGRQRRGNELVGWAWFLGLLVPVIGLVRFGAQSVADRFTYLPAIGISLALLLVFPGKITAIWRWTRAILCGGILLWMANSTRLQLPVWRTSTTLYENVLRHSPTHPHALHFQATQQFQRGEAAAALAKFDQLLLRDPNLEPAQFAKAFCMSELGQVHTAKEWLQAHPPPAGPTAYAGYWEWHMGTLALQLHQPAEALRFAEAALQKLPINDNSRADVALLGMAASFEMGNQAGAVAWAHKWPPYGTKTQIGLPDLMPYHLKNWVRGRRLGATDYFRQLLAAYPQDVEWFNNLAWSLATADWSPMPPEEILGLARHAVELGGPNPILLDTLGAAFANADDFSAAREGAEQALALLQGTGPATLELRHSVEKRLQLYVNNEPWREEAFGRLWGDRYDR